MKEIIAYIGTNLPDKAPAGVRVFANALALKDYGFDVKLISKDLDCQKEYDINEGMETWHVPRPKSTKEWIRNLFDAKQYIKILDGINDVKAVIAYELPSIAFLRLNHYCKKKNITLVCETAEWQKWENLGNLNMIARFVRVIDITASMRYAYKKSDGIIVTSSYFKDHFNNCAPILVVPTLQFQKLDVIKDSESHDVRRFVYAGQLGYRKDLLSDIIKAFYLLRDRKFVFNILGLTYDEYVQRFPDEEQYLNAINKDQEKIKFYGKVLHKDVLNIVGNSDFALIIRESIRRNNVGFPTKYGESINCGTPVIVSDFSDVVYYTKLFGVGIITETNKILEGLNKALDMDDESLMDMHEKCKKCNAFHYRGHIYEIGNFINSIIKN